MNKSLLILMLLAMPLLASAYTTQGLNSFLSSYNVSSSVINGLKAQNISYANGKYISLSSGGSITFLINVTAPNQYSFILDLNQTASILRVQLINQSLSTVNFKSLASTMNTYKNSSQSAINSCVQELGLDRGTCTNANYCQSCSFVPVCSKVLVNTGGYAGAFGVAVQQFASQYAALSSNFSIFSSSASTINAGNAGANAQSIVNSFSNISAISQAVAQNPIFPPPANPDFTKCIGSGSSTSNTPTSGPWYCNALGFCFPPTYNYTLLNNMRNTISQIQNLQLTNAQITALAKNITNKENSYIGPVLYAQKTKALATVLNTTLSKYGSLIIAANALLTHVNNSALSSSKAALVQNYTRLNAYYLSLNISAYSANLSKQMSAFSSLYNRTNSSYSGLVSLARNNTATLLQLQLNTMNPSKQVSALSFKELALNSKLSGRITNTSQLAANLSSLNKQIYAIPSSPFLSNPLVELERAIGSPIARLVLGAISMPYQNAISAAPLTALIPSLIIGAILLYLLFSKYGELKKKHKININKATMKNWKILFAIALLLFLIYQFATFSLAASANSFAPISAFHSAIVNSNTLVIVLNGTATSSMANCSAQITGAATSIKKQVQVIKMSNSTCIANGIVKTPGSCFGSYPSKNTPMVILTQSNSSKINTYSYYGTLLNVRGNSTFMNSCTASLLIR